MGSHPLFRDLMALKNTKDWKTLDRVVSKYKHEWVGFDAKALVEDPRNILLTDEEENFALFELEREGVYYGHYLFSARGPERTEKIAKDFLDYFFKSYPVEIIYGLTPVEHKGAINLNKKLGFNFHGIVETAAGPHYEVSKTKKEHNNE